MRYVRAMFVAMGWVALVAAPSFGADIKGAGSTFVFPILSRWAQDYRAANGVTVTYQPVGSGAGLAMIKSGAVDFAASDAPLKSGEIEKLGLVQFPLVMVGIVPVVNIDGIKRAN